VPLDWQLMMRMRPGWDFVYLDGTCMDQVLYQQHLNALIDRDLERLAANGVTGYGRTEFEQDLRMAAKACTIVPIVGGAGYDVANERSAALFKTVGERICSTIEDLDSLNLLS
jgi:hypothetical protein